MDLIGSSDGIERGGGIRLHSRAINPAKEKTLTAFQSLAKSIWNGRRIGLHGHDQPWPFGMARTAGCRDVRTPQWKVRDECARPALRGQSSRHLGQCLSLSARRASASDQTPQVPLGSFLVGRPASQVSQEPGAANPVLGRTDDIRPPCPTVPNIGTALPRQKLATRAQIARRTNYPGRAPKYGMPWFGERIQS